MTKGTLLGLFFLVVGAAVLLSERGHFTTPIIALAAGCLALGGLLTDPADVKAALTSAVDAWRARGGANGDH